MIKYPGVTELCRHVLQRQNGYHLGLVDVVVPRFESRLIYGEKRRKSQEIQTLGNRAPDLFIANES